MLIYNTQTEGARARAVALVRPSRRAFRWSNVTETVAPGAKSFEAWQVDQLTALAKALGVMSIWTAADLADG